MTTPDAALYGIKRQKRMSGEKEISTTSGGSFASQLGSLINSKSQEAPKHKVRGRIHKDDIFTAHHRNTAAQERARKLADKQQPFGQKHTVDDEGLDRNVWERSKRKMEDKARLYAAMKRGDVEDTEDKYAVDFDRKWAEEGERSDNELSEDEDDTELVEYDDELGRTRTGTKAQAARQMRINKGQAELNSDRFTARPTAPSNVIYGDAIQHAAFDPDAPVKAQMDALAKKRDRSLTPPPDTHFDAAQEIRQKGTGFFHFSGSSDERKQQMDSLEAERLNTEAKRKEREKQLRQEVIERDREFREDDEAARQKRKADDFLKDLEGEISRAEDSGLDAMQRIEAALAKEAEDG
ncbi:hypothetical protein AMS68_000586 [Peltaster fructicola]|uniref:Uncharacterized protein n=1 Tax=Peltaster fructicola TaxID=286661 RepID=A0A6H0XKB1_9PEZI|nr:hypothetical protein AMS68_000586 [Peltaster fructicola]